MGDISGKDLSNGSIRKVIIGFMIPAFAGLMLSASTVIVDNIWIGHLLGGEAVGAASISFFVIYLFMSLPMGAGTGASILMARAYGAKNREKMEKILSSSFYLGIIIGSIIMIAGCLWGPLILRLLSTPEKIIDITSGYLRLRFIEFFFIYNYIVFTNVLMGMGDTKTPLLFNLWMTVLNIVLDPLLMLGLGPIPGLGLNGVMYVSIMVRLILLIPMLITLKRRKLLITKGFSFDKTILAELFKVGLPIVITQIIMNLGGVLITAFANSFGTLIASSYGSLLGIETTVTLLAMAFNIATSSITGQSLGANKQERIKDIFKWGGIMALGVSSLMAVLFLTGPKIVLSLFIRDTAIQDIASNYLRIVSPGYVLFILSMAINGIFNGAKKTSVTLMFSIITLWVVRIPLAAVLSRTELGYRGIWIAITVSNVIAPIFSIGYYLLGRWKNELDSNRISSDRNLDKKAVFQE